MKLYSHSSDLAPKGELFHVNAVEAMGCAQQVAIRRQKPVEVLQHVIRTPLTRETLAAALNGDESGWRARTRTYRVMTPSKGGKYL